MLGAGDAYEYRNASEEVMLGPMGHPDEWPKVLETKATIAKYHFFDQKVTLDENNCIKETEQVNLEDRIVLNFPVLYYPLWGDARQYGLVYNAEHTIYGTSQSWGAPTEYTVPTTLSFSELVVNIIETYNYDLETLKELVKANAYQIACIMNSTGHFDGKKETNEGQEFSSFQWVMWTYIKKWTMKGLEDFKADRNDVDMWGENFPIPFTIT